MRHFDKGVSLDPLHSGVRVLLINYRLLRASFVVQLSAFTLDFIPKPAPKINKRAMAFLYISANLSYAD